MARYIDVDDLNNNFRGELCNHIHCENCSFHKGAYFCNLAEYLLKYETVDVKPVIHAHWIDAQDGWHAICSNCGEKYYDDLPRIAKYCPHCGAKMYEVI